MYHIRSRGKCSGATNPGQQVSQNQVGTESCLKLTELIHETTHGSVLLTMVPIWASIPTWPLNNQMEVYITQISYKTTRCLTPQQNEEVWGGPVMDTPLPAGQKWSQTMLYTSQMV